MERNKNGPWQHYTWEEYQTLAREGETTPSHTKFWEPLMDHFNTKVPKQIPIFNRNIQDKNMEVFTTEEELVERWNSEYQNRGRIITVKNMMIRQPEEGLTNQP